MPEVLELSMLLDLDALACAAGKEARFPIHVARIRAAYLIDRLVLLANTRNADDDASKNLAGRSTHDGDREPQPAIQVTRACTL